MATTHYLVSLIDDNRGVAFSTEAKASCYANKWSSLKDDMFYVSSISIFDDDEDPTFEYERLYGHDSKR